MNDLIVDSFAGGGGASLGITWATGRHPDIAINHDPAAIMMHRANHPTTHHLTEDVWKVKPDEITNGKEIGLLWASPDCFPAGTLILTQDGLVPIEDIKEGTSVLTHHNRWCRVISTLQQQADTVQIRGYGHYGLVTTPTHQIYSKRITVRYPGRKKPDGKRLGPKRKLVENPYWPTAQHLTGKLWATPHTFPDAPIPTCRDIEFSDSFFYVLGRWIGDGSAAKGDVVISCGFNEAQRFAKYLTSHPLKRANGKTIPLRTRNTQTTRQFIWGAAALQDWLFHNFGYSCDTKRLPLWCFSMQQTWRRNLLKGYIDADGYGSDRIMTSSVSKPLAIGIRLLATSLGYGVSLYFAKGRNGHIQGRPIVAQNLYRLAWNSQLQHQSFFMDRLHQFTPVRSVTPSGLQTVYSLQIERDASFIADGIVVHNCRHFSRAKGSQPVKKNIRGLMWVIVKWAQASRPRRIVIENVAEIAESGPLVPRWKCSVCNWKGREAQLHIRRHTQVCPSCQSSRVQMTSDMVPDPARKGITFNRFISRLQNLGYAVEWRVLNASSYGAPTHRRRLFIIARCDGHPIIWPQPTHGDPKKIAIHKLKPWRTAAECIDWSLPCPSIFSRKKPLVEATLCRIAYGIQRYVLNNPQPFIVDMQRDNQAKEICQPLGSVTTQGNRFNLVTPYLVRCNHGGEHFRGQPVDRPMCTVTASRDAHGLITPSFMPISRDQLTLYATQSTNQVPIEPPVKAATFLHQYYGESIGQSTDSPAPTFSSNGHTALVSAYLVKHFGGVVGSPVSQPLPTVTGRGTQTQLVTAHLVHFNHGDKQWSSVEEPLHTIVAGGNHVGLIYSYLRRFLGDQLPTYQDPQYSMPLITITFQDTLYILVDIGMRMFTPRELALCQGFPENYILTGSKTNQVHKIGNSVSPYAAAAVVAANCTQAEKEQAPAA